MAANDPQETRETPERESWSLLLARLWSAFILAVVVALYWWSVEGTGIDMAMLFERLPATLDLFDRMWPPDWSFFPQTVPYLIETLQLAILGTTLAALGAIPIILMGSRNVNYTPWLYYLARGFMGIVRTVPDLLLAAFFVAAVGIGGLAGVLALAVFSFGIISKLTSESMEAIDPGPIEALHAAGASKSQMIHYAVVPQALADFIGHVLYAFEINIRVATVLGFVGAGGIGILLMREMTGLLRYQYAATILVSIFAFVIVIDTTSMWVRERLL